MKENSYILHFTYDYEAENFRLFTFIIYYYYLLYVIRYLFSDRVWTNCNNQSSRKKHEFRQLLQAISLE